MKPRDGGGSPNGAHLFREDEDSRIHTEIFVLKKHKYLNKLIFLD